MAAITFQCTSCKAVLNVGAEKAGRKAKCHRCGTVLTIPAADEPAPEPEPAPVRFADEEEGTYGVIKEPETEGEGASAQEAFGWTAGKAKRSGGLESDLEEPTKKKAPITVPKGQEPAKPKLRTTRALLEPERWKKVMIGLRVLGAAMAVGVLALLLPKLMWIMASPVPEYAKVLRLHEENPEGEMQGLTLFVAMFTGEKQAGSSIVLAALGQGLAILQSFILLGGYVICLAVPPKFGTRGQVFSLVGLGGVNVILRTCFWLLPLLGITYLNLPLLLPEMSMIPAGADRVNPIMATWMTYPFWETLLAVVLILIQLAEPLMLGAFVRAIGQSMKDIFVEGAGMRLVKLTLSQAFLQICFYMMFLCGSSNVLQIVLMVVYWLAWSFWIGTLIYFAITLFWTPKRIEKELGEEEEE